MRENIITLPNCYRCGKQPCECEDGITLYHGDNRDVLPLLPKVDLVLTDPPYGQTSLRWDQWVGGWLAAVAPLILPSGSLWCYGSLRMFMEHAAEFSDWKLAQDIVWEKQNGTNLHADRFRRVHEQLAHFYRGQWAEVYKCVQTTPDAVAKAVRRKTKPIHIGRISEGHYVSRDGGPRIMRSVRQVRNCHGCARHPTEKPSALIGPVIEYSSPPGAVVLVPFAGSGSELAAARALGRKAIGIEIEEQYCKIAAERLRQGVLFSADID